MNKYNPSKSVRSKKEFFSKLFFVMMYAELTRNCKKQRIKSLCDNKFVYVEFGTGGAKGDSSVAHTTKKTWVYKKGDRYYRTSGQAPQPFLVPALKNNVSAIAAKFREVFTND